MTFSVFSANASTVSLKSNLPSGSIVFDCATGLEWLSPVATRGLSINTVLSEIAGGSLTGWRYATADETTQMFFNAGATEVYPNGYNSYANASAAVSLLSMLGTTSTTPDSVNWYSIQGFLANSNNDGYGGAWVEHYYGWDIFGAVSGTENLDVGHSYAGSWLVHTTQTTATPVPAAVWLFGSGLAGLVATRRKNKLAA